MRIEIPSQNVASLIIIYTYFKSQQCCNFAFCRVVLMFWGKKCSALFCSKFILDNDKST